MLPKTIFITATDTGIGKTFVSAVLLSGLKAKYWKPIQTGTDPMTDTQWLKRMTLLNDSHFLPEHYLLKMPCSPHLAAKIDGIEISLEDLILPKLVRDELLIIEGCGGVCVPLNTKEFVIDLIKKWNIATIVVSRTTLGTINHTLLTLEYLKRYNIPLLGVVLNGKSHHHNKEAIEHYGKVPILAEIEKIEKISPQVFKHLFSKNFGR